MYLTSPTLVRSHKTSLPEARKPSQHVDRKSSELHGLVHIGNIHQHLVIQFHRYDDRKYKYLEHKYPWMLFTTTEYFRPIGKFNKRGKPL